MTLPSRPRSGVFAPAMVVGGFIGALVGGCAIDPVGPKVGVEYGPATACSPNSVEPQIIDTRAVELPAVVWDQHLAWETLLRFRVDEAGTPIAIHAHVAEATPEAATLERASVAAFSAYRFCAPSSYPVHREWSALLRFRHAPVAAAIGDGEMILQVFVPSYSRSEIQAGRVGTNAVVGTFGPDGKPQSVRVARSSGDAVLDQKSLESMASEQFAFRPGTVLSRPLTFEQPFTYAIR